MTEPYSLAHDGRRHQLSRYARGYDAAGIAPLFPFGHGLGYTTWEYESLSGPAGTLAPGTDAQLRVRVRNCGSRPGREVVQAYVTGVPRSASPDPAAPRSASPDPAAPRSAGRDPAAPRSASPDPAAPPHGSRPVRVLGAFGSVTAAPGEEAEVTLRVPARIFAVFDEEAGQWAWPQGEFTVQAGRSSRDLRLSVTVRSG